MLDLPVPLRPMMHTRSPRAICQDTLSNNGVEPKARDTSLNLSRVMSFSKNWARILPDLRLQAAGYLLLALRLPPFSRKFHRWACKAFTRCWQKAKLRLNQCRAPPAHTAFFICTEAPCAVVSSTFYPACFSPVAPCKPHRPQT
ncbi:hypothetical protein PLUA15_510069 [Pseudomonas lundensis]|uniref:Uncharacterized protein n=1 Tax=Pseudomonas lundensis TaxID=86185 RepID=A0AAX2HEL8_9PSED|nr:hypothetical protein PLUA15_510069 [Pseudomonas lundensis]